MEKGRRLNAEEIARRVADAVGDVGVVRLHDPADGTLRTAAVAQRDPSGELPVCHDEADRGTWAAQVLRTGRPVRLARMRPLPPAEVGPPGWRDVQPPGGAVLIVPLRLGGAIAGTVTVLRPPGTVPYTLREQTLVESVIGRALRRRDVAAGDGGPPVAEKPDAAAEPELIGRSDAAVWATDLAGRTLSVTPAMSELLGIPAGAVAGLPMSDFVDVPPLSLTGLVPDEPERGDRRLRRADGTQVWLQTSSTPLVGADGRRRGTLTTAVEVTARKRAEIDLRLRLDATRGLLRLVSEVLRGRDRAELMSASVAVAAELLDAWRVGIFELGDDGLLRLRAAHGWPRSALGRSELPALRSPVEMALRSAEPLVVRDLARWERLVRTESIGAEVGSGCWIGIDGRGVLAVLEREPRAFTAEEVDLLVSLAEALTACIPAQGRVAVGRRARAGERVAEPAG